MSFDVTRQRILTRLQTRFWAYPKPSKIHGIGVFAIRNIPAKQRVMIDSPLKNRVFTLIELQQAGVNEELISILNGQQCTEEGNVLIREDPENFELSAFINHSSTPNLSISNTVDGGAEWYTTRSITQGEELTFDYLRDQDCENVSQAIHKSLKLKNEKKQFFRKHCETYKNPYYCAKFIHADADLDVCTENTHTRYCSSIHSRKRSSKFAAIKAKKSVPDDKAQETVPGFKTKSGNKTESGNKIFTGKLQLNKYKQPSKFYFYTDSVYFEPQHAEECGKHALNNILQNSRYKYKKVTKNELLTLARVMVKHFNENREADEETIANQHAWRYIAVAKPGLLLKHLVHVGTGQYDKSLIMEALRVRGIPHDSANAQGVYTIAQITEIINNPLVLGFLASTKKVVGKYVESGADHWFSIVKKNGKWWNVDSLNDPARPLKLADAAEVVEILEEEACTNERVCSIIPIFEHEKL